MFYVVNQWIKKGGKYFVVGDFIILIDDEFKDLFEGVVFVQDGDGDFEIVEFVVLSED